ncbi:MAG: transposase [Cyclobacteriaceae bacterium]
MKCAASKYYLSTDRNELSVKNLQGIRNSKMFLGEVYFWTDTIKDWTLLLRDDTCKNTIIKCWQTLVDRKKINVYGFVIMPNHIHVLWEMIDKNGKEMPYASFNKFTSHQFLHHLQKNSSGTLPAHQEVSLERKHRFWQRDALAILLDSKEKLEQKLDYIHLNPLQEKWSLVSKPEDYKWSSALFYETGIDEFGVLTDYRERF